MPNPQPDSLQDAWQIQQDAAQLGFDWPDISGPLAKVREELSEIEDALAQNNLEHAQSELGDLLFAAVNVARFLKMNPSVALDQTSTRFSVRFDHVRRAFEEKGKDMRTCTLDELDAVWDEAKKALG